VTILLVDDSAVNQRVGTAMLKHLGFDVDVAGDGRAAVNAAVSKPYQAILMDCQIPVINGCDASREIRRLEDGYRRTPIIAVTGLATDSDEARCRTAGMDHYLAKPFTLKELAAALSLWAEPTRPVLDPAVIGELERLGEAAGEELVQPLAILFLAEAIALAHALRQALADGDVDAVRRAAHTLSGASANLGATDLASMCATLATAGIDLAGVGVLLDAVEAELERVRPALSALAKP
jgi:CheY-like chemotaxis protein